MIQDEIITLYNEWCATNGRSPRYANVEMYWEDESPDDIHTDTICLGHYDIDIDNDDSILFYAGDIYGLLDLTKEDNGSDFIVTKVLDFY